MWANNQGNDQEQSADNPYAGAGGGGQASTKRRGLGLSAGLGGMVGQSTRLLKKTKEKHEQNIDKVFGGKGFGLAKAGGSMFGSGGELSGGLSGLGSELKKKHTQNKEKLRGLVHGRHNDSGQEQDHDNDLDLTQRMTLTHAKDKKNLEMKTKASIRKLQQMEDKMAGLLLGNSAKRGVRKFRNKLGLNAATQEEQALDDIDELQLDIDRLRREIDEEDLKA